MSLPSSIQPIEVGWTTISLIGLAFQTSGLGDSISDYRNLKLDGRNGPRKIVAFNNIRTQICACTMHILFMTIGVVAMTQEPVNPHAPITLTSIVFTLVLVAVNAILVGNAILSRRSRAHLEREIQKLEMPGAVPSPPVEGVS